MGPSKILINFIIYETFYAFTTDGANILAIFPNVWKSHYIFGRTLLSELVKHDHHNITLISAYSWVQYIQSTQQQQHPHQHHLEMDQHFLEQNITEIKIHGIEQNWIDMGLGFDYDEIRSKSVVERLTKMIDVGTTNANLILGSNEIQNLLQQPKNQFDLFIVDIFLSDALLGLAYYFKIPTVVISATGNHKWLNEMTGNPHNSALDPSSFLPFLDEMTLQQRIINTLMTIFEKLTYNFFHILNQESIYQRHFNHIIHKDDLPSLRNLARNVNLVLLNSHPLIQYPRAYLPNMIEIGGAHVSKMNLKLSKDLQQFIDDAPNGVIYISFGANLKTIDLPKDKLNALINAFNCLKTSMRIILKWESTIQIDNKQFDNNILQAPWWPQQAILAHPNVKIFITTGGILSTIEAINGKTPILGIPILSEQEVTVMRMERLGCGIKLNYDNLTPTNLLRSITEIIKNPNYQRNIERISETFQSNLNDPLDKAVYYINLVLKTGGADYLQSSSATKFDFIEIELIDVLLIIFAGILTILAVPSIVICVILKKANTCKPEWILYRKEDKKKQL